MKKILNLKKVLKHGGHIFRATPMREEWAMSVWEVWATCVGGMGQWSSAPPGGRVLPSIS